jgi:hypothetical protein
VRRSSSGASPGCMVMGHPHRAGDHPGDGEDREGAGVEVLPKAGTGHLTAGMLGSLDVRVVFRSHSLGVSPLVSSAPRGLGGTQNRGEPIPAQHAGRGMGGVPVAGHAREGARWLPAAPIRVPGRFVVPALGPWLPANRAGLTGHSGAVRRFCGVFCGAVMAARC